MLVADLSEKSTPVKGLLGHIRSLDAESFTFTVVLVVVSKCGNWVFGIQVVAFLSALVSVGIVLLVGFKISSLMIRRYFEVS